MNSKPEKCYDSTFECVDEEDQFDFLCEGFTSPKARMSCKHVVTPTSLTNYCSYLLKKGESRFVCGQPGCDAEWPYVEVRKMALLTTEEKEYFEKTLAANAINAYFDSRKCPGCNYSVKRQDQSNLSVRCYMCSANKRRTYEFCWQCLREWKGPQPRADRCDNEGCGTDVLEILRTCSYVVFEEVKGVTECPSMRACPTCGGLVKHSGNKCKNVICSRCKEEFCFVCLKMTIECEETPDYDLYGPCFSGIAPRQTSIPVWKRN